MNSDELALGLDQLSPRELAAFKTTVQMKVAPVSPSTANGFFQLFLAGRSCLEIAEMNKGFTLGQVVRCRVEGEWDRRLKEHLEQLMRETMSQVTQVKLESLRYQSDLIRVHHRLYGERIARFLQTGNADELAGVPLPAYKVLVQQLAELTEEKKGTTVVVERERAPEKVVEGTATVTKPPPADIFSALAQKVKGGE
jgi:hypothetical protein